MLVAWVKSIHVADGLWKTTKARLMFVVFALLVSVQAPASAQILTEDFETFTLNGGFPQQGWTATNTTALEVWDIIPSALGGGTKSAGLAVTGVGNAFNATLTSPTFTTVIGDTYFSAFDLAGQSNAGGKANLFGGLVGGTFTSVDATDGHKSFSWVAISTTSQIQFQASRIGNGTFQLYFDTVIMTGANLVPEIDARKAQLPVAFFACLGILLYDGRRRATACAQPLV